MISDVLLFVKDSQSRITRKAKARVRSLKSYAAAISFHPIPVCFTFHRSSFCIRHIPHSLLPAPQLPVSKGGLRFAISIYPRLFIHSIHEGLSGSFIRIASPGLRILRLPFRIPHSVFRIPYSVFRIPYSLMPAPQPGIYVPSFRIPHSAFGTFRIPHSAFGKFRIQVIFFPSRRA